MLGSRQLAYHFTMVLNFRRSGRDVNFGCSDSDGTLVGDLGPYRAFGAMQQFQADITEADLGWAGAKILLEVWRADKDETALAVGVFAAFPACDLSD